MGSKSGLLHKQEYSVDQDLKQFVLEWLGVASSTSLAVVIVAFLSMPLALGFHPGEADQRADAINMHMT